MCVVFPDYVKAYRRMRTRRHGQRAFEIDARAAEHPMCDLQTGSPALEVPFPSTCSPARVTLGIVLARHRLHHLSILVASSMH